MPGIVKLYTLLYFTLAACATNPEDSVVYNQCILFACRKFTFASGCWYLMIDSFWMFQFFKEHFAFFFLVKMLREELTYGQQGKSRLHTGRTMVKHRESGQQRDEGRKPAVSLRVSRTPYCRKKWKSPSKRERNQSGQHGIIIWANDWWQHQEAVKP